MLNEYLLSSRRPAAAVDYDHVGATLDGEFDVVLRRRDAPILT